MVVEPSAIHTDERGGRLLYIALTRAVQALAIVHAEPAARRPRRLTKEPGRPGSTLGVLIAPRSRRHRAEPLPPIRLDHGRRRRRAGRGRAWPSCRPCRSSASAGRSDEAMIDLGPLDQRSYVYAADGSLLTTLQAEIDRQPVPLAEIPQHTVDAVLAVEDADFYAHDGVNLRATVRALIRNVDEGETVQGGSTITQQVVKEELVGNAQTVDRKAREAVLARRLEDDDDEGRDPRALPEHRVPRATAPTACRRAPRRTSASGVAELDVGQSAFLAGLIANPSRFDPIRAPEASRARRDLALQRMAAEGYLTDDEADYIAGVAPSPPRSTR